MILYHLKNSRSQRIVWLLEELALDYQLEIHEQSQNQHKYPLLKTSYNSNIQDMTESSAICHFLCQQHNQLLIPPSNDEFWSFSFYSHFADASLMSNLAMQQVFRQIVLRTSFLVRWVSCTFQYGIRRHYLEPELQKYLQQMNQHFSQRTFIAGTFSYADILLWFPLKAASYAHGHFQEYPALHAYLERLEQRPSFQTALIRGQWSAAVFESYWAQPSS